MYEQENCWDCGPIVINNVIAWLESRYNPHRTNGHAVRLEIARQFAQRFSQQFADKIGSAPDNYPCGRELVDSPISALSDRPIIDPSLQLDSPRKVPKSHTCWSSTEREALRAYDQYDNDTNSDMVSLVKKGGSHAVKAARFRIQMEEGQIESDTSDAKTESPAFMKEEDPKLSDAEPALKGSKWTVREKNVLLNHMLNNGNCFGVKTIWNSELKTLVGRRGFPDVKREAALLRREKGLVLSRKKDGKRYLISVPPTTDVLCNWPGCFLVFETEVIKDKHILDEHEDTGRIRLSEICGQEFDDIKILIMHIKTSHPTLKMCEERNFE